MAPSAVGHFNLSRVGSKERHPHRGNSSSLRQLIFKFISHLWTECVHYQQALHRPQTVLFPISPSTQSTDTGAEGSLGWGNRRKYRRKLHIGDLGEIFQRLSRTLSCTVLTGLLVRRSRVTLRLIICIWLDLMGVGSAPRSPCSD